MSFSIVKGDKMIVRKIVDQQLKEFEIQEYVCDSLKRVGLSGVKLQMTPMGEKIIISASRPGMIVGRKGQSIRRLTSTLKRKFNLENPQIEINEIQDVNVDANIIAERIANSLEKFGPMRFKAIGHKAMEDVMNAGALGIEILISGKIPSSRAKKWRFYQGYLKKSGTVATEGVKTAYRAAQLKSGTVGIQVRIMPPDTILPDDISIKSEEQQANEAKEKESAKESELKDKTEAKEKKHKSEDSDDDKDSKKAKKIRKKKEDVKIEPEAETGTTEEIKKDVSSE